jgi:hypothetical protein
VRRARHDVAVGAVEDVMRATKLAEIGALAVERTRIEDEQRQSKARRLEHAQACAERQHREEGAPAWTDGRDDYPYSWPEAEPPLTWRYDPCWKQTRRRDDRFCGPEDDGLRRTTPAEWCEDCRASGALKADERARARKIGALTRRIRRLSRKAVPRG